MLRIVIFPCDLSILPVYFFPWAFGDVGLAVSVKDTFKYFLQCWLGGHRFLEVLFVIFPSILKDNFAGL